MLTRKFYAALILWFCACTFAFASGELIVGERLSVNDLPESKINVDHLGLVYFNLDNYLVKEFYDYMPSMAPLVIKKITTHVANDDLVNFLQKLESVAKEASALGVYVKDDISALAAIKIAQKYKLPIVFFVRCPSDEILNSYEWAYFMGYNLKDAGRSQGEILVAYLRTHHVDFNRNGEINIILIKGQRYAPATADISEGVLEVLEESKLPFCINARYVTNGGFDGGHMAMDMVATSFDLRNIDGIICNNDLIALGALRSIMRFCYNGYGSPAVIPIVGVGGVDKRVLKYMEEYGSILGSVKIDIVYFVHAFTALAHEIQERNKPTEIRFSRMDGKKVFIKYNKIVTRFNHYLDDPKYEYNWLEEGLKKK